MKSIMGRRGTGVKTCFCIDGLDEFKGDPDDQDELIALIQQLSHYQNVKVLLSSRPEPFIEISLRPNR